MPTAAATWQNRIIGHGVEAPDQLLANPRNWRIHPKAQQDALSSVLDKVGWVQDVIVNQRTGHVVDGHLRVSLAISRQEPEIPVVYVDLAPEEEALVLASLDPLAAMAVTDAEMLADLLGDVTAEGALADMLDALSGNKAKGGKTDPDAVPPTPEEPTTKPGDLWLLGEHRLLCGDATKADDVTRLMGGAQAAMMWTDPPYGVDYGGLVGSRANQKKGGWADIGGDALDDTAFLELLTRSLGGAGAQISFVWHPAGARRFLFWQALQANGWVPSQEIVWVKNALVFGRADYQWRHEPCIYARRPGAPRQEIRSETTVWEEPKPTDSAHPTQKPVALAERPMRNHTQPGDVVFDPFLGSGTTLIACERLGRRCYAIEIEPRYVDVAVRRWEEFTGNKAVLDG